MKQELPFAVALLAAGCLLCFSQLSGPANSTGNNSAVSAQRSDSVQADSGPASENDEKARAFEASRLKQADSIGGHGTTGSPETAMQVSYQADAQIGDRSPNSEQGNSVAKSQTAQEADGSANLYLHQTSNPKAVQFLADVSKHISDSQPFGSSIELTGNLFGQVVTASGNYYQMGQGTHKSRTELRFGTNPNSPSVIQLCDGRFVYKFQSFGPQQTLEFVDLQRVREMAGESGHGITPTGWVASGGIASLFQHLASAFNFGELETANSSIVTLRGSWDDHAMQQIAGIDIVANQAGKQHGDRWSKIPTQLPHAVELVFHRDENQNYFPKRIKFLKFAASKQRTELKPMVVLGFGLPQPLSNASDRFFVVDSTDLDLVDMTENYIARIEDFDQLEQTASAVETIDR